MAKTRSIGSVRPSVHWAATVSRNGRRLGRGPGLAGGPRGGGHLVGRDDRGEGVLVPRRQPGRDHAGAAGQVVAEAVGEQVGVGPERHRLEGPDGGQPDAGVPLSQRHPDVDGPTRDLVVDRRADPLVGVVRGAREGVVRGTPDHAVVVVEGGDPDPGAGRRALGGEQDPVVEVGGVRLRHLDVPTEGRQRRGVLPDVEGWLDVGAQHHPPGVGPVAAGSPGADRLGGHGGGPEQQGTGDQPGRPAAATRHRPTGPVCAQHQPGEPQRRHHRALRPDGGRRAHPQQDHRGEQQQRREQRQQGPQPHRPGVDPGQEGAEGARGQAERPRQHQQPSVAVHGRQRGQQVLPAEEQLVGEQAQGARRRRDGAVRAQAERPAEEEEGEHGEQYRRDRGPPQRAGDVDEDDPDQHPGDADHGEAGAGVRRRQPEQRRAAQGEQEAGVHQLGRGRAPAA